MIDKLLKFIAPHYCYSCGEIGDPLCSSCEYDIISEPFESCLLCRQPLPPSQICVSCQPVYVKAWCVAWREGALEELINQFKFMRSYESHAALARLLAIRIDNLPANTVIVPVPTIPKHIRQRGYDHALLIARRLARIRKLKMHRLIQRSRYTEQLKSDRVKRLRQAKLAFRIDRQLDPTVPYLIVDDVVTTGATIQAAAKALHQAGAKTILVAVLARQPLD